MWVARRLNVRVQRRSKDDLDVPTDRASKSSYKAPGAMTRTSRVLKGMLVRAE